MARGKKAKNEKKLLNALIKGKKKQTLTQKINKALKKSAELKWLDHTQSPVTVFGNVPVIQVLTDVPLPAAGAQPTDVTRIGDSIKITSIDIRAMLFYTPDVTNDPGQLFRIVIFQYKPNNGLLPPSQARLLNNDENGFPGPLSHQVISYQNDYHILYDRMYTVIGSTSTTGVSNQVKHVHINVPLKRATKKLEFDGNTTAHNNAVYMAIFSSSSNAAGIADPAVGYQTRLRFLDM